MTELEVVYEQLNAAKCPEDVFGSAVPINRTYRDLLFKVHPDHNKGEEKLAGKAFELLQRIHKESLTRLSPPHKWGSRLSFSWREVLDVGGYKVTQERLYGSIADLYRVDGKDLLLKVARNHDDNDLLWAEAEALEILKKITPPVDKGVPSLIETLKISGKWKRQANVIPFYPEFLTLEEARKRTSIPARTLVWMFKRTLTVLGWTHHLGLIHGAVLPNHIMVFPDNTVPGRDERKHSIRLIDWCYSVKKDRTRLSAIVPEYEHFYAPEILDRKLSTSSDIYSAAKTIQYMTVDPLPDELNKILERALDKSPDKRYKGTKDCFDDWVKAAEKVYDAPKWFEFKV